MDQARNYLPYSIGIARWSVFLLLKVVPAMFYRPYTSKTLERDIQRHELLMKRGTYLCFRTGSLSGIGGGILGFFLAHLTFWLTDTKDTYEMSAYVHPSLLVGFLPGVAVFFLFAIFIEKLNIRARRELMSNIRGANNHSDDPSATAARRISLAQFQNDIETNSNDDSSISEEDPNCLVDPVPFTPSDATIVVPVYEPPPAFKANITSLLLNNPAKILIVADITCVAKIQSIIDSLECSNSHLVEVVPESQPGKRAALSTGLRQVRTRLTCFVDDDCQWCDENYLVDLIKPFDNRTIGGVGSKQIMRPSEQLPLEEGGEPIFRKANILEVMADFRLAVRYIDLMATTAVDRGASCISGRTMCFLTSAIGEEQFHDQFMHESLCGIHLLSGDDKFITRYVIKKGYKTYHQLQKGCVLTTTFESGRKKHMSQLIRWSRNTWRSDITALFIERKIWRNNPFTAFLLFDKLFTPFFLLYGLVIIPVYTLLRMDWVVVVAWLIWLYFSRALKLALHFWRRPDHIIYLPIWICYQYLLGFVRVYALLTMLRTHWGNRAVSVVGGKVIRTGSMVDQATSAQSAAQCSSDSPEAREEGHASSSSSPVFMDIEGSSNSMIRTDITRELAHARDTTTEATRERKSCMERADSRETDGDSLALEAELSTDTDRSYFIFGLPFFAKGNKRR